LPGNIKLTAEEMEGTRLLVLRVHFYDEETVDEEPEENRRFFRKEMEDDEPRR
ncbi:MAG: HlyC/CorC family transporter, partial [Enterococcus sp.]|nr:HlyC/CorC family transporter [Enterococcus sp.]